MANVNDDNWINKHLKFSIARACNKKEKDITKEFLSKLTELNLSEQSIKSLHGLQYARSLNNLILNKNYIKTADEISNLSNLENLELSENRIENISFLPKLKKLKSVSLDYNNIRNIPNLSELKHLDLINISNNRIDDFSFMNSLVNKEIKIIASEQLVCLNPIFVNQGDNYIFKPTIIWEDNNIISCNNVQVTGKYSDLYTDERPSLLYSISKIIIKNICSDCLVKADFYHEVPFFKSGLLSGVLIQPLLLNVSNASFSLESTNPNIYSISGKLVLNDSDTLNNKVITIIDSNGNKYYSTTNSNGMYTFNNLKEDRYTLLFPFLNDYNYVTPSLYVINLKDKKSINIDAFVSSV
ncbi:MULTISPECIES: leucine-rich repeat domain-containing protein [unclassified Romboutsia]|uniref:leucine-rich repeat domain-containing protein n=1 Tax=unclassified Romboutsia TaxID=2626894 RepID=UPI000820ACA5|nr:MULTISPECIES: hypothetical protein [unclassified Romboutsia]SCH65532.1 Internalin-A precursor [uncultured Clostridium sp.]